MVRLALVLVLGACGSFMPTPRMWNQTSGEVDCSGDNPAKAVGFTAGTALIAVAALAAGAHPEAPTYDMYGYQTNYGPDAGFMRAVGYAAVGATVIGAAVSALEWTSHSDCRRLDSEMRVLVATTDCTTIARIDAELSKYPRFRDTVIAANPKVALCVATRPENGAEAQPQAEPQPEIRASPPDACHQQRSVEMLRAQALPPGEDRTNILVHLPKCD